MDVPSSLSQELLDAVKRHLDAGQFKEALELPNDNKYAAALKDNSWDLIPHLISRIENDTIIKWPALQLCCERLLMTTAERANPEEVLLELIEQCEIAQNDAQFIAILKPMQTALIRVDKKQSRSLEWCLNTIKTYLEKLDIPDEHDFTQKEKLLMDCNEDVRRILKIYGELPMFYDHFLNQIVNGRYLMNKNVTICFLVSLFGKPFCCLDLEYDGKTKSQSRDFAERLFKDLCSLQNDLYVFLDYIKQKCYPSTKKNRDGVYEDAPADIFLLDEHLTPISLGTIFYLLLTERLLATYLPQIYSPIHIYQECIALSVYLMKQKENMLQYKGMRLGSALLEYLPEQVSSSILGSTENYAFVKALSTVAVYCNAESIRKEAVVLLKKFILRFDDKGRHLLIINLYPALEHQGIKGFVINIYKDVLLDGFQDDERIKWFRDRMPEVVKLFCVLPHGVETDLVDSADHIISTLNYLRYLILKDTQNKTGIWNSIEHLKDVFLKEMRESLNLSLAHYEARLNEFSNKKSDAKLNVNVDNSPLNLPMKNKKEVVASGINALHLINSVLSRLEECIQTNQIN